MKAMFLKFGLILAGVLVGNLALANVTLYTDRPTERLKPVVDDFTARTGEAVTIVELPYEKLFQRLKAEGASSPADLIFVKDMIYLAELVQGGYFQPLQTASISASLEPAMRDPQNLWVGVTYRARTVVYEPSRVNPNDLKTYEDLADEKWAGRLCLRTGRNSYNEALVSSFIENMGYSKAKDVVNGMVENLGASVFPNDNKVIEAIANGNCDLGVVNSYYLAGFYATNPNFPVKIAFLNQGTTGTHINGTGIGVAATSKNPALAEKLIGLLLEDKYQLQMSSEHLDFPAKKGLVADTFVKDWVFQKDTGNWSKMGAHAQEARRLMSEVGYQ